MKGLDLAEAYYRHYRLALINEEFATLADRIAVGLVGPGSECFGFDDQWSQDHDWGPGFSLWLTDEDHTVVGEALQQAYNRLPDRFMGFGPRKASPGEEWRVGVNRTSAFFARFTGLQRPPQTIQEWLRIPEHALATCTNGKVFDDPLGDFTRWRQAIDRYYPEDIRLKKIASRCITIAQSGQYNFIRSIKRGEKFAAAYARTQFCTDLISLVFTLNRRFTPFYKWLHRAVADLPVLGAEVNAQIVELLTLTEEERQADLMENLVGRVIEVIRDQGLSHADSNFLLDHAPLIHEKINDTRLKTRLTVVN